MLHLRCILLAVALFILSSLSNVGCDPWPTSFLCGHKNDVDLSSLENFLWNHIEVKNVITNNSASTSKIQEEYVFSFCDPLGRNKPFHQAECLNSTACYIRRNLSQPHPQEVIPFGDKELEIRHHALPEIGAHRLEMYSNINCTNLPIPRSIIIEFTCDQTKGLGKPLKALSQGCTTRFNWPTSAICSSIFRPKTTKCYVYDDNGQERDLTPLMKDVYPVISPPTDSGEKEHIFINVCKEITTNVCFPSSRLTSSPASGVSSCVRRGRNRGTDFYGIVPDYSQMLFDIESSEVVLHYYHPPSGGDCIRDDGTKDNVSTIIRFKCPQNGSTHMYGLESRKPFLLKKSSCEMEIEWETEHACPADTYKESPHDCLVRGADGSVLIDLEPLKNKFHVLKNVSSPSWRGITDYHDYVLNLCGPLSADKTFNRSEYCGNETTFDSMSACRRTVDGKGGEIIGTMNGVDMKYADDTLTIIYRNGKECPNHFNPSPYQTMITFNCDRSGTSDSKPKFVEVEDCTFIFEVNTTLVCSKNDTIPTCTVVVQDNEDDPDDGLMYDLSPLRKKADEMSWRVALAPHNSQHSVFPPETSLFINVCGPITKLTRQTHCPDTPSSSALCSNKPFDKDLPFVGEFVSSPSIVSLLDSDLSLQANTNSAAHHGILLEYFHKSGHRELVTRITLVCKPGVFDSSPVFVSQTEEHVMATGIDQTVLHFTWHNGAACPVGNFLGTNCTVTNENLGYILDLNRLYRPLDDYVVKKGKYTYYLNFCSSLRNENSPCQGEDVSICQVDDEQTTKPGEVGHLGPWIIGRRNDDISYWNGMVKMNFRNGTPYNNPDKTPRSAEVTFICDEDGNDKVELISEHARTYWFRMYTKAACPHLQNVVSCLWDNGTHAVDLGMMSLIHNNHFDVKNQAKKESHIFYLNVCRPLSALMPNYCKEGMAACMIVMKDGRQKASFNLGVPQSPPTVLPGESNLSITYVKGDVCSYNHSLLVSTKITFICDENEGMGTPKFVLVNETTCQYEFVFPTDLVCSAFPASATVKPPPTRAPVARPPSVVIGIGFLVVLTFLALTVMLMFVANSEMRNGLVTRFRNLVCGSVASTNPIHYSQLTTIDNCGDQVSFISVGSPISSPIYNATTLSLKDTLSGSTFSAAAQAFKEFTMPRKDSEDQIPFSSLADSNDDLET